MDCPKITIVTIAYNSEKTIRETFESIRSQHYNNMEYLIIDGGSKDSTLEIAAEYTDIVTKIISEPDKGISDAMNKGIRLATGDLVGIIHSDDLLATGALARLAREWDGKSDVYYGHCLVIDEMSKPMHILRAQEDLHGMEYSFQIPHPSTFVTRHAYQKYGVFDMQYKCAMDYDLLLRLYKAGADFKYVDAVLAHYRTGGTNMRLRQRTIDEVRNISVAHGGNRIVADYYRGKKILTDAVRPILKKLHLQNKRVQKL